MSASTNTDPDLGALRRDVASLIEHVKGRATNRVQNAVNQIDRGARGFRREVDAEGERSARAISLVIEKRPLLALIIALGIGYVSARAFLRRARPVWRWSLHSSREYLWMA
jgi:hypothetical protein